MSILPPYVGELKYVSIAPGTDCRKVLDFVRAKGHATQFDIVTKVIKQTAGNGFNRLNELHKSGMLAIVGHTTNPSTGEPQQTYVPTKRKYPLILCASTDDTIAERLAKFAAMIRPAKGYKRQQIDQELLELTEDYKPKSFCTVDGHALYHSWAVLNQEKGLSALKGWLAVTEYAPGKKWI